MIRWLRRSALVVAVLVLATCLLDTDWEVSHQVLIEANSSEVWDVLIDLERYPQWNRYSPNVTGKVAVGEVVWVEAHLDKEVQRVRPALSLGDECVGR